MQASREQISVFDMLKIGVGPSSSHTMGPWRAAQRFLQEIQAQQALENVKAVDVYLYGSLAKTGRGHGTDKAVLWGLQGEIPQTCELEHIWRELERIETEHTLKLNGQHAIHFEPTQNIHFEFETTLPFHPNGVRFVAVFNDDTDYEATYFSVGGGFVTKENEETTSNIELFPYPCDIAKDVLYHCEQNNLSISDMVWENEKRLRPNTEIRAKLLHIWDVMLDCIYRGCHTDGQLPGGLQVVRRASRLNQKLLGNARYDSREEWLTRIKYQSPSFREMLKWISCFALAVNEENASFGRVVTAPTNGASGVIPAVLMYYYCFGGNPDEDDILRFLMVAGEMGSLFKKGATISAALGGCQAEIGVSSAMAAAALTELLGGTVSQCLMAAEIAMEHHLGMTCDPIAGLVQIPCIERNTMGAMKAITASSLALESNPLHAKVSLDNVIKTMWETALDMNVKYKETAEGGLAVHIPVNVAEC